MADHAVSISPLHTVDIAFCCDQGYLQPLTVAIASVLANSHTPGRLRFWIVSKTLGRSDLADVATLVAKADARLELLHVATAAEPIADVPLTEHFTEATYYRLLLPDLVPASLHRLIYLDCDVVVRRPIEELWAVDLRGAPTGAVLNPRALNVPLLGLSAERDYFNAGVLLIDLVQWRRDRVHQRALDFASRFSGKLPCHDQDALNQIHAGNWHRLDLRWNQQFKFFKHPAHYLGLPASALRRARREPFVVHYSSNTKPWQYSNDHPWRRTYFRYLDQTPYRGWRPQPRDLNERFRRTMRSMVPHPLRSDVLRYNVPPRMRALKIFLVGSRAQRTASSPRADVT